MGQVLFDVLETYNFVLTLNGNIVTEQVTHIV